jgi:hypothetical protein
MINHLPPPHTTSGSCLALIAAVVLGLLVALPASSAAQVTGLCFGEVCVPPDAVAYLGDFCWTFPIEEGEASLVLGVTHMGAKRFALNGTIGTEDQPFPITGMATRRGLEWLITMSATGGGAGFVLPTDPPQVVDVAGARLFYVLLDGPSLNGQLLAVDVRGFSPGESAIPSGVSFAGAIELSSVPCE